MLDAKKTDPVRFGYYCVALIDILGQQESLLRFKDLPHTEKEREEFIRAAKETFGVISGIRNLVDSFYRSYTDYKGVHPLSDMSGTELKFQGFSDTIIIYVPLATDSKHIPITSIYAVLLACGSTFLCSMAAGHPLRGGVEVGMGAEIYEGEIYGPALSKAYRIESKIAEYPRIVVGSELVSYLMEQKNCDGPDLRGKYIGKMSESCLGLLTSDVDGQHIVDYLGESFMKKVEHPPLQDGTVKSAYEFTTKETRKWREQKNSQLAFRYTLLHNYFVAKLEHWKERF